MNSLVGYTGFVGSNLFKQTVFDGFYNSKNIESAFDTQPEILVYCGVRAEKYLANKEPETDLQNIKNAFADIRKINPKKIILISTIDVYKTPIDVNEDSEIELEDLHPYGLHRYYLEQWVETHFEDCLIVRLPGLYGENIKKNFIYDYLNIIPFMLNNEKYQELFNKNSIIGNYYKRLENGLYGCNELSKDERVFLKNHFLTVGFNALNFTDSRASFQFYNLSNLWAHIQVAVETKVKKINLATEPIIISELYKQLKGVEFTNHLSNTPPKYNFKTKYDTLFSGNNGYILNKDYIIKDIVKFIRSKEA